MDYIGYLKKEATHLNSFAAFSISEKEFNSGVSLKLQRNMHKGDLLYVYGDDNKISSIYKYNGPDDFTPLERKKSDETNV